MQARSTRRIRIHQGDAPAQLRGANGSYIARRTSAQKQDINSSGDITNDHIYSLSNYSTAAATDAPPTPGSAPGRRRSRTHRAGGDRRRVSLAGWAAR